MEVDRGVLHRIWRGRMRCRLTPTNLAARGLSRSPSILDDCNYFNLTVRAKISRSQP